MHTDGEKYRIYDALEKDELIKMLIECGKNLNRVTCKFHMGGLDTSGKCINCRKYEWEH